MKKILLKHIKKTRPKMGKQIIAFNPEITRMIMAHLRPSEASFTEKIGWYGAEMLPLENYEMLPWNSYETKDFPYWLEVPEAIIYLSSLNFAENEYKKEIDSRTELLDI